MFCSSCGAKLNEDAVFCGKCGTSLEDVKQIASGATGGRCHYHPGANASGQCKICNKFICKDCIDMYGVDKGAYAGNALCCECTKDLIVGDTAKINWFIKKANFEIKAILAGCILGIIFTILITAGISGDMQGAYFFQDFILFAIPFGWVWIGILSNVSRFFTSGLVPTLLWGFAGAFAGPIMPFVRIRKRKIQIEQFKQIQADSAETLKEIDDYIAYTNMMESTDEAGLEKLCERGGSLSGNSFAQAVTTKGASIARSKLRQSIAKVLSNSNIVEEVVSLVFGKLAGTVFNKLRI